MTGVCEFYLDAYAAETEPSLRDKLRNPSTLVKDLAQRIRFSKYQIHELVQILEFLTHIHLAASKPPELDEALSRLARSIERKDWMLIADSLELDMAVILDKMELCLHPEEAIVTVSSKPILT